MSNGTGLPNSIFDCYGVLECSLPAEKKSFLDAGEDICLWPHSYLSIDSTKIECGISV